MPKPVSYTTLQKKYAGKIVALTEGRGKVVAAYAELLGFKPDPKKKTKVGGVEGRGVTAYPGEIKVRIGGKDIKLRCYFLRSRIMPLLGRLDFWDKFNIFFDNKNKEIALKLT